MKYKVISVNIKDHRVEVIDIFNTRKNAIEFIMNLEDISEYDDCCNKYLMIQEVFDDENQPINKL